jgi:hypothetical protein
MDDRLAVHTADLHRLASAFGSAGMDLAASGRTVDESLSTSGAPLGRGAAGRSATEAYTKTCDQLSHACAQLGELSVRTGNALRNTARLYDAVEEGNVRLANTLPQG